MYNITCVCTSTGGLFQFQSRDQAGGSILQLATLKESNPKRRVFPSPIPPASLITLCSLCYVPCVYSVVELCMHRPINWSIN